jgi:transcriptional regulator with XRE-family HTH domain
MLMPSEYKRAYGLVNNCDYLIFDKRTCSFAPMTYGERLRAARNYAGLSQQQLAEKAGCSQPNVTGLENSKTAVGSEYTVQFAKACGVRSEWLAMEQGDMVDGILVEDERLKHLLRVCEKLPTYAVDQLVLQGDAMAELIERTKAPNGLG